MYVVYQSNTLAEAELLKHRLTDEGIECTVRNGLLHGAIGELPANLRPEICVFERTQIDRARELALQFERRLLEPSDGIEWRCERCEEESPANFELCWKCRCPREPAGDAPRD